MARTAPNWKQGDVTKLLKAGLRAGVLVDVEIEPNGKIIVRSKKPDAPPPANDDGPNEWDDEE